MGDRVIHAARPEWGEGHVVSTKTVSHDGGETQRLTVRFDRAGLKTVLTAMADIRRASDAAEAPEASSRPQPDDRSDLIEQGRATEVMTRLPEPAVDPFATPGDRLRASLKLYRFNRQGATLLDWAAMQSGLTDPLSRFSRHELEELFDRFQRELAKHVQSLAKEMVRSAPPELAAIARDADPAAQRVLRSLDMRR